MDELLLLKSASLEIKSLRNANHEQSLRLDMFDKCFMMFTARIDGGKSEMSPDIVYEIDKYIDSVNEKQSVKSS